MWCICAYSGMESLRSVRWDSWTVELRDLRQLRAVVFFDESWHGVKPAYSYTLQMFLCTKGGARFSSRLLQTPDNKWSCRWFLSVIEWENKELLAQCIKLPITDCVSLVSLIQSANSTCLLHSNNQRFCQNYSCYQENEHFSLRHNELTFQEQILVRKLQATKIIEEISLVRFHWSHVRAYVWFNYSKHSTYARISIS